MITVKDEIKNIITEGFLPAKGEDLLYLQSHEDGTHFVLLQHRDADDLEEDESEVAVWITNSEGQRKDTQLFTCRIGNLDEFIRWENAAQLGFLISFLKQEGNIPCTHERVVKVYAEGERIPTGGYRKKLVFHCADCKLESPELLEKAKEIINLTPDED